MDFQVNGDTYFVDLAENAWRWEVLVSTPTGARPIPVYVDAPLRGTDRGREDERKRQIVN